MPLLIFTFGPISGAHFNPVVTVTLIARRAMVSCIPPLGSTEVHCTVHVANDVGNPAQALSTGVAYVGAQLLGGIVGAAGGLL